MNNKNKTAAQVFVWIVIIGLVATYIPLFFAPSPVATTPADQTASLVQPPSDSNPDEPLPPPSNPTSSEPSPKPEGFSGLNEESQSLEDLNNLLNE